MATKRRRITISLGSEDHAVIERLAQLQKRPKSSVISEIMESIIPPLRKTVALLEAARDAPDDVKEGLRKVVEDVHDELTDMEGRSLDQLDFLAEELQPQKCDDEDAA